MNSFNELDKFGNMSDEEFDLFIKEELNSSLMSDEDIKVDEDLINKTMKAIDEADMQDNYWGENNIITFEEKKVNKIKRYIPILSMAACTCFIVMAASIIYSKVGNTKSEDSKVDNYIEYSQMEDPKEDMEDDTKVEMENSMDGFSQEDFIPNGNDSMSDMESIEPEINNGPTADEENSEETPQYPESDSDNIQESDIVYDVAQILNITEEIEWVKYYDEMGNEFGEADAEEYLKELYEIYYMDFVEIQTEYYDESELDDNEYVIMKTESKEYCVMVKIADGIENSSQIVVLEKH